MPLGGSQPACCLQLCSSSDPGLQQHCTFVMHQCVLGPGLPALRRHGLFWAALAYSSGAAHCCLKSCLWPGAGAALQSSPATPLPTCAASLMHHCCAQGVGSADAARQLTDTKHHELCSMRQCISLAQGRGRRPGPAQGQLSPAGDVKSRLRAYLLLLACNSAGLCANENMGSNMMCFCALMELTVEVAPSWKGVKGASGEVKPAGTCCFRGVSCCMAASSMQSSRSSQREWRERLTLSLGYLDWSDSLASRLRQGLRPRGSASWPDAANVTCTMSSANRPSRSTCI